MERIWLKEYPAVVPPDINPDEYSSLTEIIERSLRQHAARAAYVLMDVSMTYAEVDEASRRFAAWTQSAGMKPGDRIAIMMPNVLQYPIVLFGALRAGLTVVNTNPLYTAPELQHQLADSGATAIVVLENFCSVLQEVLAQTQVRKVVVTAVGDLLGFPKRSIVNFVVRRIRKQVPAWHIPGAIALRDALHHSAALQLAPVTVRPDDIAFLQYTGGTTGVAKGAMLTHRNMVANVLQAEAWDRQVATDHPVHIVALPLYHIFALTACALLYLKVGGLGVLIPNPRDMHAFIAELVKHPPNVLNGVNTLFNGLMNDPGFGKVDFSHLVASMGGGMAVQRTVAERWKKLTGCVLTQGWGLTETSPVATANPLSPDTEFNGSIGLPVPSTEISIRDDDGRELELGKSGEICVRGPQVMAGYWNRPDETAKVMLPDGWLRTGDIGHIDEKGYVFLEDRKKDMILVSGFNVYPNEVESVIAAHPDVVEVAAVSEPDEHSGEAVAVYIVRRKPSLTAEAVIAFARKSLTGYKVPKHVYFRESLPKTNVGKILRRALRESS